MIFLHSAQSGEESYKNDANMGDREETVRQEVMAGNEEDMRSRCMTGNENGVKRRCVVKDGEPVGQGGVADSKQGVNSGCTHEEHVGRGNPAEREIFAKMRSMAESKNQGRQGDTTEKGRFAKRGSMAKNINTARQGGVDEKGRFAKRGSMAKNINTARQGGVDEKGRFAKKRSMAENKNRQGGVDEKGRFAKKRSMAENKNTARQGGVDESEERAGQKENANNHDRRGFIQHILHNIDTDSTQPISLIRTMKQVDPTAKDSVIQFVMDIYKMNMSDALAAWDIKGSFQSQVLTDYLLTCMCPHKLMTVSLPLLMGAPLLAYKRREDNVLVFHLDSPVSVKEHVLYLDSGIVDGNVNLNLRAFSPLQGVNADSSLADALLRVGIADKLRFDVEDRAYRSFEPVSGRWERSDLDDDRGWALRLVMSEIKKWADFAIHIQEYCEKDEEEDSDSLKNLRKMRAKYGEGRRSSEDVLQLLRPRISCTFGTPKHLLCFKNGLVDLKTGELLGPARPSDLIKHSVPHPFDPTADVSWIAQFMQSFFPEACYGEDSKSILDFIQVWQGYRLTGEGNIQKSLWLTGRGSNGKSVLSKLNAYAFGPEIHHSLSMEAFQKEGTGNNDDLFSSMHARCVDVMENTDSRKVNEKLFKSLTGGDNVHAAKKFVTGRQFSPCMKLTFFNNDCPLWSTVESFAIHRRCWKLPMRAQFLEAGTDSVEQGKLLDSGHGDWIFKKNINLESDLKQQVKGYLLWCVQGAVKYYKSEQVIAGPEFVLRASREQQRDLLALFCDFVSAHIESYHEFGCASQNEKSLSCQEILDVFSEKEDVQQCDLDNKTSDSLFQKMKEIFTGQKPPFINVQSKRLKQYPTRQGLKDIKGYCGVVWKSGEIDECVHKVRTMYRQGQSRPTPPDRQRAVG